MKTPPKRNAGFRFTDEVEAGIALLGLSPVKASLMRILLNDTDFADSMLERFRDRLPHCETSALTKVAGAKG